MFGLGRKQREMDERRVGAWRAFREYMAVARSVSEQNIAAERKRIEKEWAEARVRRTRRDQELIERLQCRVDYYKGNFEGGEGSMTDCWKKAGFISQKYTITHGPGCLPPHKPGDPVDPTNLYFVLNPTKDRYARLSLEMYRGLVQRDNPKLAQDLDFILGDLMRARVGEELWQNMEKARQQRGGSSGAAGSQDPAPR